MTVIGALAPLRLQALANFETFPVGLFPWVLLIFVFLVSPEPLRWSSAGVASSGVSRVSDPGIFFDQTKSSAVLPLPERVPLMSLSEFFC